MKATFTIYEIENDTLKLRPVFQTHLKKQMKNTAS